MNLLAIRLRWELRRFFWFWAVVVFALAVEVPLVLMIQWQHIVVNRITLLPIGVAVVVVTVGGVRFVEKFIVKSAPPDEDA